MLSYYCRNVIQEVVLGVIWEFASEFTIYLIKVYSILFMMVLIPIDLIDLPFCIYTV